MLVVVVAVAASGYRLAGYLAAVSTAAWFDFFLTQPYERFSITHRTDAIETTVLLLVIGANVPGRHGSVSRSMKALTYRPPAALAAETRLALRYIPLQSPS